MSCGLAVKEVSSGVGEEQILLDVEDEHVVYEQGSWPLWLFFCQRLFLLLCTSLETVELKWVGEWKAKQPWWNLEESEAHSCRDRHWHVKPICGHRDSSAAAHWKAQILFQWGLAKDRLESCLPMATPWLDRKRLRWMVSGKRALLVTLSGVNNFFPVGHLGRCWCGVVLLNPVQLVTFRAFDQVMKVHVFLPFS